MMAQSSQVQAPSVKALARLGNIRQLGYVVEDLDVAVEAWQSKLGVGPWTIMRGITLLCEFEGQASQPQIDIALAYRGDMQIELIQQRNQAASPYLRHVQNGLYGLHHTAFLTERIDADTQALQDAGLELVCDIRMPMGGRYVYLRSPVETEHSYIELLEATGMMKQLFASGMQAAASWQGEARPLIIQLAWPLKMAAFLSRLWSGLRRRSAQKQADS